MKIKVSWKSKNLYFKADEIEKLAPHEYFKIETPEGDFIIKKSDFDIDFKAQRESESYFKGKYSTTFYNVSSEYIRKYFYPKKKKNNQNKILIFRIGYMEKYDGVNAISGGGAYPSEYGEGGEMWNFREEGGRCYGYVMTKNFSGLDIEKIYPDHDYEEGDEEEKIDIVFIARRPNLGQVVVGWYKNATIFHKEYRSRNGGMKKDDWKTINYLCEVDSNNAVLLVEEDRLFHIPKGKGFPGQSNIWYGAEVNEEVERLLSQLRFIMYGEVKPVPSRKNTNRTWRPDKDVISKIESSAINTVWEHYEKNGYSVISVEKDNRGWDLEVEKDGECLYLEVKGHLGEVIQFELTPNEYDKMKEYHTEYRVCVVCDALTAPTLDIFDVVKAEKGWHLISQDRIRTIRLFEKVAAKAAEITKDSE